MISIRTVAFLAFVNVNLYAQFHSLMAPGDGSTVYFSEYQPLKGVVAQRQGRIYSFGNQGLTLLAEQPTPAIPAYSNAPHPYYTTYYSLERLDRSRDGSITALTGRRDCTYADSCSVAHIYSTAIERPGRHGPFRFQIQGMGFLSRNGRYLVSYDVNAFQPPAITDLTTGQQWPSTVGESVSLPTTGRIISDNGTFVIVEGPNLIIQTRDQSTKYFAKIFGVDAVIDAGGQKVVYSGEYPTAGIHLYQLATQSDSILFSSSGEAGRAAISADGTRATFLVYANGESFLAQNGSPQLYTIGTDGTGLRQISTDPVGITDYVLSDDGTTAWYVSGTGRLVKIDVESGVSTEVLGPPPSATLNDFGLGALASGSAFSLTVKGVTTQNATAYVNGLTAPIVATGSNLVVAQVPWEIHDQNATYEIVTESSSPFDATFRGTTYVTTWEPELIAVIHQDWSGFVTSKSPAHAGEIVQFYATGLGPVDPPVTTGQSGPITPLSSTTTPYACNAQVLFSGLAPRLTGYYQVAIQVPQSAGGQTFSLSCTWPAYSPFGYSIPIAP